MSQAPVFPRSTTSAPTRPEPATDSPEDTLLECIDIDAALARLAPEDRALIVLLYAYDCPGDYTGPWPATPDSVGHYVGTKYRGRPRSGVSVRTRHALLIARWRWAMRDVSVQAITAPTRPATNSTPHTLRVPLRRAA